MKKRKKRKFKKRYWLLIDLAIAIVIVALLLYKPARYKPAAVGPAGNERQVSPYLTNVLLPQLHNGAQRDEPFELVVTQKGINEIITWSKWPKESEEVRFSAPVVFFVPDSIILMGTANIKGMEFVITIVAELSLDEEGLLNLQVAKVKVGTVNITLLAKILARRMYAQSLAGIDIDMGDWRTRIAASLLNNEPFEPVFKVEDKKVRVEEITVTREKLTIRLVPVYD